MGNCLAVQEKVIKVMKPDRKILEYKSPIKVYQVVSDFGGHGLCDSLQATQNLLADTTLRGGRLYFLMPVAPTSPVVAEKLRFSIPEEEDGEGPGTVRIKLVISKQKLQEMLRKGGISVGDMVSQHQTRQSVQSVDRIGEHESNRGWKPALESIPESD